jgi:modulator of FtsH protease HflC
VNILTTVATPGHPPRLPRGALLAGGGLIALALVARDAFFTVQPTEMAGVRRMGVVVTHTPLGPGLHTKLPLIETADRLQVSLDTFQLPDLAVYTVDNQPVHVGIAVTYRIPAAAVLHLLYDVGRPGDVDIAANMRPVIADRALRVFARRNTIGLSAQREEIAAEIRREVGTALGALFGVEVADLQITAIRYSDSFTSSVEAAMPAKNEAVAAENQVARIRYEGEQRKVKAEADAVAQVTQAEAERQAAIVRAEGEAQALTLKGDAEAHVVAARSAALGSNPSLVAYTEAERWNGQMPTTVLGGQMGALPVFDVGRAKE